MRTFEPCSTAQTAAMITALKPNEVFVFGSNKNGLPWQA
jgi:tRNA(Leu) C34 or U34 (ribose-2'-O)-methylase TrmL